MDREYNASEDKLGQAKRPEEGGGLQQAWGAHPNCSLFPDYSKPFSWSRPPPHLHSLIRVAGSLECLLSTCWSQGVPRQET